MDVFTVCPEIERESPYLPSVSSVSHGSIEEMNQGRRTGMCWLTGMEIVRPV